MEVRFPTYSPRALQRPPGTSGQEDGDESFIQVIGDLAAGAGSDGSGRAGGQAGDADARDEEQQGPPPPPALRAEAEAIHRAVTPVREPEPEARPAPSVLGRVVDVIA